MGATEGRIYKESRTGKRALPVPDGVQVDVGDRNEVHVKGPKGELRRQLRPYVRVEREDGYLRVKPVEGTGEEGIQHQGLSRKLLYNMIQGVHEGFKVSLDLLGIGYRAEAEGREITMMVGVSHPVKIQIPEGVDFKIETIDLSGTKYPRLHLESCDKELLGQVAARIRSKRPPEPYKGKGIRYTGERVREKAGKAGKGK